MAWITVKGDIKRLVLEEVKQAKSKGRRWQRPDVFFRIHPDASSLVHTGSI